MKVLSCLTLIVLPAVCLAGERVIKAFDPQELLAGTPQALQAWLEPDGSKGIKVTNPQDTSLQACIFTLEKPGVTAMVYAVKGQVKYRAVRGDGYLELWNHFAGVGGQPPSAYFSRTLGNTGEMAKITGQSEWRDFTLPFDRSGASQPPEKLVMNLRLPGAGEVFLRNLRLVEFNPDARAGGPLTHPWWSDRAAGWVGGLGGAFLGCLASLLAVLAGKGKARNFVTRTSQFLIVLGVSCLVAGAFALIFRQPYGVTFPLLLIGSLLLGIIPFRLKQFQAHYEALELRRMKSLDALGS
jgi:hypothetical protein